MNIMILELIVAPAIATVVGAFCGWFFTRKKQNIDTIDAAIGTWQKVVDSLENQVVKLLGDREKLQTERDNLAANVRELLELREKDSKEIKELNNKVELMSIQLKKSEHRENLIVDLKRQIQEKDEKIKSLELALKV